MNKVNPLDHLAIQNVLSRYCQALDSKDLVSLSNVFTQDVVANYPFNPRMDGVRVIINAIQNRYKSSDGLAFCWRIEVNVSSAWGPFELTTASQRKRSYSIRMGKKRIQSPTSWGLILDRARMKERCFAHMASTSTNLCSWMRPMAIMREFQVRAESGESRTGLSHLHRELGTR